MRSGTGTRPPRFGRYLLDRSTKRIGSQPLCDDLGEEYARISDEHGRLRANCWYWKHVFRALPRLWSYPIQVRISMAKSILKMTVRRFRNQKLFTFINMAGLAVGMACTILILLYVQDELSVDRFHVHSDLLYRVNFKTEDESFHGEFLPGLAADYLRTTYPEIVKATVIRPTDAKLTVGERSFTSRGSYVHEDFLEMFTFPLTAGDPKAVFSGPPSFLITRDLANRLFGDRDVIGETILVNDRVPVSVSGVLENVPEQSTIQFEFLLNFAFAPGWARMWDNKACETFVMLHEDATPEEVDRKIVDVYNDRFPGDSKNNWYLQPFSKIYLHGLSRTPRIVYVMVLVALAVIILTMACVNFMNMSTARAEQRMKEIGLRKVVGVTRGELIRQFLFESILLCASSALFSLIIVSLLIPSANTIVQKQLVLRLAFTNAVAFMGIIGLTGFMAGLYPAFFLSAFRPVEVLRGTLAGIGHRKKNRKGRTLAKRKSFLRNGLVVVQFSVTIGFIICILMVSRQIRFVRNMDLGYDDNNVIHLRLDASARNQLQSIKNTLLDYPGIEAVTVSSTGLDSWNSSAGIDWEGNESQKRFDVGFSWVDYDYLSTLKLNMIDGRFFSRQFPSDAQEGYVVNEAALRTMELGNPVGKRIVWSPGTSFEHSGKIIGVIHDYHTESLHKEIRPFILRLRETNGNMFIRIQPEDIQGTLTFIGDTFEAFSSNQSLNIRFLDDQIGTLYATEELTGKVLRFITLLAVFVSCLGLFGLTSYSIERRTKEIGIRKVVGAPFHAIVFDLLKDMMRWVILANLIAWPLSWFAVSRWLERFAFRTSIHLWLFLSAGLIALGIALITILHQTVRAARMKTVDSLRYE